MQCFFFLFFNIYCVCMHTQATVYMEVRGQHMGNGSLLPHRGPRDQTQVIRPGSESLYLMSYLTGCGFFPF